MILEFTELSCMEVQIDDQVQISCTKSNLIKVTFRHYEL